MTKRLRLKPNKHIEAESVARHSSTTFVIGLDYDVKGEISWTAAVMGIIDGIYTPFKVHESKRVRSAGGDIDMAWPVIVRLNYWVEIPHRTPPDLASKATRYDILRRDGWTCGYCGGYANTVDHIMPESRGGGWTWGNLIAACVSCNGAKDNKTPEEVGMTLLWNPRVSSSEYAGVQAEVWRILEEQCS